MEQASRAGWFLQLPKLKPKSHPGRRGMRAAVRREEASLGAAWSSRGNSKPKQSQARPQLGTTVSLFGMAADLLRAGEARDGGRSGFRQPWRSVFAASTYQLGPTQSGRG
ncbi:UNVERIFIED_CONTAM: hypothetical protein K2H54_039911 [Gekko kuhli]